jgi:hypothetical protein
MQDTETKEKKKYQGVDPGGKNLRIHCRWMHRCTVPDSGINGLSSLETRHVAFSTQGLLFLLRVGGS